jgi:hypothetical protein
MKGVHFDVKGGAARCIEKLSVDKGFRLGTLDAPTDTIRSPPDGSRACFASVWEENVKRANAICRVTKLAMPALIAALALQLGGRCWAAADLADLPFDQAVKQLTSFDMDSSAVAGSTADASASTALPPAPLAAPKSEFGWGGPAEGCGREADVSFLPRLVDTYEKYIAWDGDPPPAPGSFRPPPATVTNPPYPFSTWPMGATQPIGFTMSHFTPLMDTLYCGPYGQIIKDSGVQVYGWADVGGNLSTSHTHFNIKTGYGGNAPRAYDVYPNTVQLDQATLYIERDADENQMDHYDFGFRITNLYGTDYKYTFAHDILSNQYIDQHKKMGYDPVMFYVDWYDPFVAEGMNIRVGRYISIPDIEAQLAPDNYTYSHSLLYGYDPYTQFGIVDTIRFNKNWTLQTELSAGNDVAVWDFKHAQITPAVCVQYLTDSGNDSIYPCANTINDGKYNYNNLQHLVTTWYHHFDQNGPFKDFHTSTETWYMWERSTPNYNHGPVPPGDNPPYFIPNGNGAICSGTQLRCTSSEYSFVNYLEYQWSPRLNFTFRNGFFDDFQGQRTGYRTEYYENLIGLTYWLGEMMEIRPEVVYEHSFREKVYDANPITGAGRDRNQVTFAMDIITHY